MKNLILIFLLGITLVSCDDSLRQVDNGNDNVTIKALNTACNEQALYKIVIDQERNTFDVYDNNNIIIYKNCSSTYKNNTLCVEFGILVILMILSLLIGLAMGLPMGLASFD